MSEIGHNNPPEPIVSFKERLAIREKAALELGDVSEANAQTYRDEIGLALTLKQEVEAQHSKEKRPLLDASRQVDQTYFPVRDSADGIKVRLQKKLDAWIKARKAEADRKAADAAKALREAEEAKRKAAEAQEEDEQPSAFLMATAEPLPDTRQLEADAKFAASQAAAATRVTSGAGGFSAYSVRTKPKVAKITDPVALASHYAKANNGELLACLQKIANADIRKAGKVEIVLPGCEQVEQD